MGGECSSVFSSIENVASLYDTQYLWIDPMVDNQQNTSYYIGLKQKFNVLRFKTIQKMKQYLQPVDNSKSSVNVISSARFELDFYSYLDQHPKISRIILFTRNQEKSATILSLCPRIDGSCFHECDFIKKMQDIDFESKHHILLFNKSKIEEINKWVLGWRSEIQDLEERKRGKDEFVEFALKFAPSERKEIRQYESNYDLDKVEGAKEKMIMKWLFQRKNCFFFSLTARILETSYDNEKIKFVRQPILDIYSVIKSKYNCSKTQKCVAYLVKTLNNKEIDELNNSTKVKQPSYLCFSSFVNCSSVEIGNQDESYLFIIHLPKKDKELSQNSGFIFSDDKKDSQIIINIDNYFEILSVSIEKRTVELSLVTFPARVDIERSDRRWPLQLHNRYIRYLISQYPLDIIGKIQARQLRDCQEQFMKSINLQDNKKNQYNIYNTKLKFIRAKLTFRLQNLQDIEKELSMVESQVKKLKRNEEYYCLMGQIYCLYAEIYINLNRFDAFHIKMVQFTDISQKIKNCNKPQITDGEYLLKIEAFLLFSQINKANCEQNQVKLAKLKQKVNKKYPQYVNVSQISWIIRMVEIKLSQTLNLYNLALNSAKQLQEIVSYCDGRHERKKQYENIMVQITKTMAQEADQRQIQKKKKKIRSDVPLEQLFHNDKPLILDLSGLDI